MTSPSTDAPPRRNRPSTRALPLREGLAAEGIVHFTGIGGIGMSGIAETMHNLGFVVQGSDRSLNPNTVRLEKLGIALSLDDGGAQALGMVERASVLVYSSAVPDDHKELRFARSLRIPIVRRAEILAELMRFKTTVAIAGTHGKTTTTSLVAALLERCGLDPTVINGGIINALGSNARKGESAWMVVEADESDGSFLHLRPTIAVVTNIDAEHMDHYADFEALRASFRDFVHRIPFYGFAVMCVDHPVVQQVIGEIGDRRVLTYGTSPQALYRAEDVRLEGTRGMRFSIRAVEEDLLLRDLALPMFGEHNVLNALAAASVALRLGLDEETIACALAEFSGVKRRFTEVGLSRGVRIIDDYAHHPVEIRAVLAAARPLVEKRASLRAVFQPHRYTRLKALFEDFCRCFNDADQLYITEVYAAGEEAIEDAESANLVEGLRTCGHRDVRLVSSFETLKETLCEEAHEGDYILFLGAGSITQWAQRFAQETKLEATEHEATEHEAQRAAGSAP